MFSSPKGRRALILCFFTVISGAAIASATAPSLINYQGRLLDSGSNPVTDGTYSVTFAIYKSPTNGSPLWSEQLDVTTTDGLFSVLLGSVNPITADIFKSSERYLSIQIGANPEQLPRQQITTTAFAFRAVESDSTRWTGIKNIPPGFADGVDDAGVGDAVLAADQDFTGSNRFDGPVKFGDNTMRVDSTGIEIGIDQAPDPHRVVDITRSYNTTSTRAGLHSYIANSGKGMIRCLDLLAVGLSTGSFNGAPAEGLRAEAFTDGDSRIGVHGLCYSATPGLTAGVGEGVYGEVWYGQNGIGVYGVSNFASDAEGLRGIARQSISSGVGVYCRADSSAEYGDGAICLSQGNGAIGYGAECTAINNAGGGFGVFAQAASNGGDGVGVYGSASSNSGENWAGYFSGDVYVSGTVSSPANKIVIDHPLDPENKFLVQNAVESPEMLEAYSGNVVLDESGEATIELPDWFQAANKDFRYQLTCVGGYAPVYVAQEISDGSFEIAGGKAGLKVSWQIQALRDDPYARAHPLTVEKAKRPNQQGKYMHPEAYGLSEEMGIDYENNHRAEIQRKK